MSKSGTHSFPAGGLRLVLIAFLSLFSFLLASTVKSDALLATTGEPPLPRLKPQAPSAAQMPELSRGLNASEKALKMAISMARAGRHSEAASLISPNDETALRLLDWMRYQDELGHYTFEELDSFLTQQAHWPGLTAIRRNAEALLPMAPTVAFDDNAILKWFTTQDPKSIKGTMVFASALLRRGESEQAKALLRRSWQEMRLSAEEETTFLFTFPDVLVPLDHFTRLDRLLYDSDRSAAKRQAKRMGADYRRLADARLALSFNQPGVDGLIRRVPRHLRNDAGLLYERIRWRFAKRRLEGVVELLDDPGAETIAPERLWRIRRWVAGQLIDDGDYEKAYEIIASHSVADGLGLAESLWVAGWVALHYLNDPERALPHFERLFFSSGSPISRSRGAFWAAEAAEIKGYKALAKTWRESAAKYTSTFYGQLAAYKQKSSIAPRLPVTVSNHTPTHFEENDLARTAARLHRLGETHLFEIFMRKLADSAKSSAEFRAVAAFAERIGRHDLVLKTAKLARRKGFILDEILFPEPNDLIEVNSPGRKPEEALVLAVIRQESAFDPGAVSRAGARGLMQLMPLTAKRVARKEGERFVRDWLTFEPAYNLRLGQAYLQQMIDRYQGHYALALAAYNAGPHRVDRWLQEFGDPRNGSVELTHWIERIPFYETRNYVQRVLEAMTVYRSRRHEQLTWSPYPPDEAS